MTELSNKRETKPSGDTGNKKPLDFGNVKIEKYSPTFGNARNLYIPFKVPHGSHLIGLCLRVSRLKGFKKIKRFVLRYWFKGEYRKLTLGIFKSGYGVKEVNDKLYQIVKEHTNEKGLWIKNHNITEREKETKITKAQFAESLKKTIRETIKLLFKAGYSESTRTGTLTGRFISQCFSF